MIDRLRERHVEAKTWDSGNPEAVDGWVSWCDGCGQRPWPCDTRRVLDAHDRMAGALRDVLGNALVPPEYEDYYLVKRSDLDAARAALAVPKEEKPDVPD